MNKARIYTSIFAAVLVGAAVILSPLQGQAAGTSAPGPVIIGLEVNIVGKPPEWMCLGDSAPITFTYTLISYADRGRLMTPYPTAILFLNTTTTKGTLSKSSFWADLKTGSGAYTTTFKATEEGLATIKFDSSQHINITGHSQTETTIEKCDHKIVLMADDYESAANGGISSMVYGEGGIQIDEMGVITGGGTYQWLLGINFASTANAFTCEKFSQSTTNSTFVAMGQNPGKNIVITIQFKPFDSTPVIVHCVDAKGLKYNIPAIKSRHITPDSELNLGTLSFGEGAGHISFKYGNGSGDIFLIKKKGKGK
jgi:hypothetical protein